MSDAERAKSLFLSAIGRDPSGGTPPSLDGACGGDDALFARVKQLLEAHRALGYMPSPASLLEHSSSEQPGTLIGPYKLLEAIGEGGMGQVYMAEQTVPVRRKVALKIIKPGMDSRQVIARFEAERQALALMDHPNIARVLDAGATETGRPYFAMELVRGISITEYCDQEHLSVHDRLELFVLVCRAVQHAHQKGVIHRDLKPSNILVTLHDGVPVPKIIDFGIAKATGQVLTDKTLFTGFAHLVGTPLYMSPEQAEMSGLDVDTRSDIYSLGVLLYEILTGTTPFDGETLRRAAFDEMRRIIREDEPQRPSNRLSVLGATVTIISANRGADPRRLNRTVRGELDWIAMKALEKDRRRRYETANDFAADVMNYLTDRPVEACPPSARYRFLTYARRNRAILITAALMAGVLLCGTAVSVWQAAWASEAAAEAQRRADESSQVLDYLIEDVFSASSPGRAPGRNVTMMELLDDADRTLGERFRRQPLVEATMRFTLGQIFGDLDRHAVAVRQYQRAAELRKIYLGAGHPETLAAENELSLVLPYAGKKNEAVTLARSVLAGRRRVLGPSHPDTLFSQARLAVILSTTPELKRDECIALAQEAAAIAAQVIGPDHEITWRTLDAQAFIHRKRGEFGSAVTLSRNAVAGHERVFGPLHPETLWARAHLTQALAGAGRIAEARAVEVDLAERFARSHGLDHPSTRDQLLYAIRLLRTEGNFVGARDLAEIWIRRLLEAPAELDSFSRYRRSDFLGRLAMALATLPEGVAFDATLALHAAEQAGASVATAQIQARQGRFDRAKQSLAEGILRSPDDPIVLNATAWFMATCSFPQLRDPTRAVELARGAVAKSPLATHWNTLGTCLYRAGDWDATIEALEKSEAMNPGMATNAFILAMAYRQRNENDQAQQWYDKAVGWMVKNHEMHEQFQAEAEALLGLKRSQKPHLEGQSPRSGDRSSDGY